jgi:hypothetical protein
MNDDDLAAVRRLVAPRTDGPAPTWDAVVARRQRPVRRRPDWVGRVAIPVAVAVVVLAVAAGAAVTLRGGGGSASAPGAVEPAPGGVDPTPTTKQPRPNAGATAPEAVAALESLAEVAASVQPAELSAGQLIYVRSVGWNAAGTALLREEHEMWVDPQGMIALKIVVNGEDFTAPGPKSDPDAEVAQLRQQLADEGPSIHRITPAWLDSLPTEPGALLAVLRDTVETGSRWSPDHQVFTSLDNLLWHADSILPADLRVGLYRAMARMTGLTAKPVTIDGRDLVAVRHAEANDAAEILFDPATGHAVGSRRIGTGEPPPSRPVVPGDDQDVTYQSVWTHVIVDEVDQTG